jgi:endogenous inhibitor of DNA gyrase (YacG/DUF329 family)
MDHRNDTCHCPTCGMEAGRLVVSAPALASLTATARNAHEVNERSAHSPMSSKDFSDRRHPVGCGCCGKSSASSAGSSARGYQNKRPWMISH